MILCFQDMLRVATCQLAHLGAGVGRGRLKHPASLSLHFPTYKMGVLKGSWKTLWACCQSVGCFERLLCNQLRCYGTPF